MYNMNMKTKLSKLFLLLPLLFLIAACAPSRSSHGNLVTPDRLSEITIGESNKDDVIHALGSPTSQAAFNDNIWYYIGLETTKQGFLDAKIDDKKLYMASFDEEGLLSNFQDITAAGVEIPIAASTTPTHGNEFTIMEQFLGNLGRFNGSQGQ